MLQKILQLHPSVKLTALRQEVLEIIIAAKTPITAYEILRILRQTRSNAEPPTVYRVIDYFMQQHVIHRIECKNQYMLCTMNNHEHESNPTIIMVCKKCKKADEINAATLTKQLQELTQRNGFIIDNPTLEISGVCKACTT